MNATVLRYTYEARRRDDVVSIRYLEAVECLGWPDRMPVGDLSTLALWIFGGRWVR